MSPTITRSRTATQFVEVPDIRTKALVLSNLTGGDPPRLRRPNHQRHRPTASPCLSIAWNSPSSPAVCNSGPQAALGNYILEITVVDPVCKGDKTRATQRTSISVVPR